MGKNLRANNNLEIFTSTKTHLAAAAEDYLKVLTILTRPRIEWHSGS